MIEFIIISLAVLDRLLLKRNHVQIVRTERITDEKAIRFNLVFESRKAISSGKLTYTLRSKKRPKAVLSKCRTLKFSQSGLNSEYLTFDIDMLEKESGEVLSGTWILDVEVERSCSRINPLYKIFPTKSRHQEELEIAQ